MITKSGFGSYELYTLKNDCLEVAVTALGATVLSVKYNGKECTCGYETPEAALAGKGFLFKTIGRYANRIGKARFTLDGREYILPANEGENQLHGGPNTVDTRVWEAEDDGESVTMSILMPDGDNGFPGNMKMSVKFSLVRSALRIEFFGETDAPTVFAPTVHPYFNIGRAGSVLDAKLQINAAGHLEVDGGLIPTGKILPCENEFDFSSLKRVAVNFDDCFVTPEEYACTLEMNGYVMEMWTDFPAIQIYTADGMPRPYKPNDGIAIEPEFFPDSPNRPEFPSTVLRPGEKFEKYVEYKFYEA